MLLLHSCALSACVQGGLQDICTADNISSEEGKIVKVLCCERRTYASSQLLVGRWPFGSYAMSEPLHWMCSQWKNFFCMEDEHSTLNSRNNYMYINWWNLGTLFMRSQLVTWNTSKTGQSTSVTLFRICLFVYFMLLGQQNTQLQRDWETGDYTVCALASRPHKNTFGCHTLTSTWKRSLEKL